jgi:hypothetical protein
MKTAFVAFALAVAATATTAASNECNLKCGYTATDQKPYVDFRDSNFVARLNWGLPPATDPASCQRLIEKAQTTRSDVLLKARASVCPEKSDSGPLTIPR